MPIQREPGWNKCVSLRRKSRKKFFNGVTKDGIATDKNFWNLLKSFLTNIVRYNKDIMIFDGKKNIANKT